MALDNRDQNKAMKDLAKLFSYHQGDFEVILHEAGEDNYPIDILEVTIGDYGLIDEAVNASFFFTKEIGEYDMYFIGEVTFSDEIKDEMLADVFCAMNAINSRIMYGAFNVNPMSLNLSYRVAMPINISLTYKELLSQTELIATQTLVMGEKFSYVLTELAKGNITLSECLDVLPKEEA